MIMPFVLIIQLNCNNGQCLDFYEHLKPGYNTSSLLESGRLVSRNNPEDYNVSIGNFPATEYNDLEPTLVPYVEENNDADLINK